MIEAQGGNEDVCAKQGGEKPGEDEGDEERGDSCGDSIVQQLTTGGVQSGSASFAWGRRRRSTPATKKVR